MTNGNSQEFVFYSSKLNYKAVEGAKGKEYFIEGHISTGDLDLVNDIVTKSCMDSMTSQFDNRVIKLDFEHETFRGKSQLDAEANKTKIPLGKAIGHERDSKGVKVKWKMNPTWKKFDEKGNVTMTFKDIWNNVENEMYDAFSIAYVPTKTVNTQRQGKSVRLLDDVNLLNVALTGNAINPEATMTAIMAKSLEFMKSKEGENNMDKVEIKTKREIKSYKEDGKHVHTPEKPMGEHDHPEIESEIERLWKYHYDLSDQMYKQNSSKEETMIKSGKDANNKMRRGATQMVDKKDEKPAETQTETGKETEAGKEGSAETEQKSITELKSVVDSLVKDVDTLKKENSELKAIVEKPIQKAKGAENKEEKKASNEQDAKSFDGPLDLIN